MDWRLNKIGINSSEAQKQWQEISPKLYSALSIKAQELKNHILGAETKKIPQLPLFDIRRLG